MRQLSRLGQQAPVLDRLIAALSPADKRTFMVRIARWALEETGVGEGFLDRALAVAARGEEDVRLRDRVEALQERLDRRQGRLRSRSEDRRLTPDENVVMEQTFARARAVNAVNYAMGYNVDVDAPNATSEAIAAVSVLRQLQCGGARFDEVVAELVDELVTQRRRGRRELD